MILAAIIGAFYAPLMLFQCKPISYWWDLSPDAHGTCISANVIADILYLVSALNSAADWIFGVLPIFMVRKLQMPAQTKAVVMLLLGFAAMYVLAAFGTLETNFVTKEANSFVVEVPRPSFVCHTSTR